MARKMSDKPQPVLPQDLASLKRPALQKLCKRLGIKANGKNTDMVRSLEEYREKYETCEEESGDTERENTPITSVAVETSVKEDDQVIMNDASPKLSCSSQRKRRNTYSVSPSSANSEMNILTLPGSEDLLPTATKQSCQGHISDNDLDQRDSTHSISPKHTMSSTFTDENVPPSPSKESVIHLSPPLSPTMSTSQKKQRRTHSVSPSSSLLLSGTISMDTGTIATVSQTSDTTTRKIGSCDGGSATTDDIMALLDKRVADREADPAYIPPVSTVSSLLESHRLAGSKIPVVSKAVQKINKAHEKQFNKMTSILEFNERKKKRALAIQKVSTPTPPAKKQKVAPKTPATTGKPPTTNIRTSTAGPTITRPVTVKKSTIDAQPKLTNVVRFQPNMTTEGANFNFTNKESAASSTKTPLGVRTQKSSFVKNETFTFSAAPKPPIKKHKGKLPNFDFSIY